MLWMAWAVPGTAESSASLAGIASSFLQLQIRGSLIRDSRFRTHLEHTLSRVIPLEGMSLVIVMVQMDEAEMAQEIARVALQGVDDRSRWGDLKALDALLGSGVGMLRHWEEEFPAEEAASLLRTQGRPDFLAAMKERFEKERTDEALDEYFHQYFRSERVRMMVTVPERKEGPAQSGQSSSER
jgi:hypothetical protein